MIFFEKEHERGEKTPLSQDSNLINSIQILRIERDQFCKDQHRKYR